MHLYSIVSFVNKSIKYCFDNNNNIDNYNNKLKIINKHWITLYHPLQNTEHIHTIYIHISCFSTNFRRENLYTSRTNIFLSWEGVKNRKALTFPSPVTSRLTRHFRSFFVCKTEWSKTKYLKKSKVAITYWFLCCNVYC